MRVTAAVAPRMASGDPAASKGKSAGGASFGKRRDGREERCAAPPVFWPILLQMQLLPFGRGTAYPPVGWSHCALSALVQHPRSGGANFS
eukprot:COSAG01_NODE_39_length_33243_cov_28.298558_17_plen_90_part_00